MNLALLNNISIIKYKKKYQLVSSKINNSIIVQYLNLFNSIKIKDDIITNELSKEEFKISFMNIVNQIFYPEIDINTLMSKTFFIGKPVSLLNSNSFVSINKKLEVEEILIDFPYCMESISFLLHEYGHCFVGNGYPYNNYYYNELLSICLERIASSLLKVNIMDNCDAIRFNYTIIAFLEYLKMNDEISFKQKINNYTKKENALAYIISDLMSIVLMNFYNEDPKKFLEKINLVITNDKKLEDVIKYYDIDLTQDKSYEIVKRKLKKLESVK